MAIRPAGRLRSQVALARAERDGQVHRRLGQPDPADGRRVDVLLADRHPGPALQHRQDHADPGRVQARRHPARRLRRGLADQGLHLGQERPPALQRDGHAGPRDRVAQPGQEQPARIGQLGQAVLAELEAADLVGRARTGSSARGPCAAGRAGRRRSAGPRPPGARASAGPAIDPSLVTCPTSTVVSVRCLASAVSAPVTSRIWVTPPGAPSTPSAEMVCTESTMSRPGFTASTCSSSAPKSVSAARKRFWLTAPIRSARSRTCAADSSPVTYRTGPGRGGQRARLEQQRGLAHARLAGQQDHRAGDQPAAEHPVELAEPGRPGARPPWRRPPRSASRRGRAGPAGPAGRGPLLAGPSRRSRAGTLASTTVPHCWHSPHRPAHFVLCQPHSEHW